jgi:hypothetical protein
MSDSWDTPPEELRELIAAEKARPDPASEVQARILDRLCATVGFVPGPADAPILPPPAPHAPGLGALARLSGHATRRGIATFLVGAAVGATAVGTVDRMHSRPAAHESPPARVAPAEVPVSPPPAAPPQPVPDAPAVLPSKPVHIPAVTAPVAEAKDKRLEAERKLVEMARTALARGQTAGALAALKRHQRLFPTGELCEERDSLWVRALVATGDYAQAREQAARFRRHYPHSLFAPVVEQAMQSIP